MTNPVQLLSYSFLYMINCLIIEDELAGQQLLLRKLGNLYPNCKISAIIDNKQEAIEYIRQHQSELDIVFMDVEIKGGSGLEILTAFHAENRHFETLFITAYDKYAIQALNENASYYLLKPIIREEFRKAMDLLLNRIYKKRQQATITVLNKGAHTPIKISDIVYLESDGAYTTLVLNDKQRLVTSKNIGYFERILSDSHFIRCHHSYLVNREYLKAFKKGRSGFVIMQDDTEIPVSQRRMNELSDVLNDSIES